MMLNYRCMKKIILLFLISLQSYSQILNPGFETFSDTGFFLFQSWKYKTSEHFKISADSVKHSGSYSLKLIGDRSGDQFFPFSQNVKISVPSKQLMSIHVFVKTAQVSGTAGLWCQLWDKENKQIAFSSLQLKGISISGTQDWTEYQINILPDTSVKSLLFGGFLQGKGEVWYDDFSIKTSSQSNITTRNKRVERYARKAKQIVKSKALYSDSLNWTHIDHELKSLVSSINSYDEVYLLGEYLIDQLHAAGDKHSMFSPKIVSEKRLEENLDGREPQANYIKEGIGYILIPGFDSGNDSIMVAFASKIQDQIKKLDEENDIKGWIIDLRENTGGNMAPMILGLGPLLNNEDTLGYFIRKGKKTQFWNYKNGQFYFQNKYSVLKIKDPYSVKQKNAKIAVLIGDHTASSGEFTAMSFYGKKNTKFFGQETAGYTTANGGDRLPDGSYLILAEMLGTPADRIYYPKLIPHQVTEKEGAAAIEAAIQWITQ